MPEIHHHRCSKCCELDERCGLEAGNPQIELRYALGEKVHELSHDRCVFTSPVRDPCDYLATVPGKKLSRRHRGWRVLRVRENGFQIPVEDSRIADRDT